MKRFYTLTGLLMFALLYACDNSEILSRDDNFNYEISVNILNYSDLEFPEGTFMYLGAQVKDTFIAVDSIRIDQIIPSKDNVSGKSHSKIVVPKKTKSDDPLNLWKIDLQKVRNISHDGSILIRFPEEQYQIVCHSFCFQENEESLLELKLEFTQYGEYFHSLDIDIDQINLKNRKDSKLVFKQL